jgi:hypothetical protein
MAIRTFWTWAGCWLRPTKRRLMLGGMLAALASVWLLYFTPAQRAARHRLSEADDKSMAALDQRLRPVAELFGKGRKGSKAFADEALSWGGKWALVKGTLGIGGGNAHREFLAEVFARRVFSEQELRDAMEGSVNAYLIDLDGVESEMLVRLRADLADLDHSGQGLPSYLRSDEAFRREYRQLADQVLQTMKTDLGVTMGREVTLLVASEVVTQAALQGARTAAAEMGIEAGVLGAGATSTVATIGIGLVIAVILDYVLDAVFKVAGYDPAAKIAGQVNTSLDKTEAALTSKSGWFAKSGSLRQQMEKLHEARSTVRQQTVALILKGGKQ